MDTPGMDRKQQIQLMLKTAAQERALARIMLVVADKGMWRIPIMRRRELIGDAIRCKRTALEIEREVHRATHYLGRR